MGIYGIFLIMGNAGFTSSTVPRNVGLLTGFLALNRLTVARKPRSCCRAIGLLGVLMLRLLGLRPRPLESFLL